MHKPKVASATLAFGSICHHLQSRHKPHSDALVIVVFLSCRVARASLPCLISVDCPSRSEWSKVHLQIETGAESLNWSAAVVLRRYFAGKVAVGIDEVSHHQQHAG